MPAIWRTKLTISIPAAAAVFLLTATVQAFDREDAEKLKATNRCEACDLAGVLMHGADLSGAVMSQSNLTAASFDDANLTGATIREADLSGADLGEANLTRAKLQGSNLAGAFLHRTNLTGANLTDANMEAAMTSGVIYCRTTMPSGQIRRPECGRN